MKRKRVMIAAPKSGSGKTMIVCGLLSIWKKQGKRVVSYKCGPDYIDPMFHEKVIEIPSRNLDTYFTDENTTRELFLKDAAEDDFAVLEGVMGLFDGLGGIREEGSSYHLAKVTKTPIILVVDAKGMGRSILPEIAGFLQYDSEKLIQGVLLNRMTKNYYETIKPLIEQELKVKVLGFFPEHKNRSMGSRHLGLVLPDELPDIKKQLQMLSFDLEKTIETKTIVQIAERAEELKTLEKGKPVNDVGRSEKQILNKERSTDATGNGGLLHKSICVGKEKPVIAVAKDEAFCFYYEDNLRLLKQYGAKLQFFSPLKDENLPPNCDAILLGGGYPELYAEKLSRNHSMHAAIKEAFQNKMPLVAECGGFLYLHETLIDKNGTFHTMVGLLSADCHDTGKLVRFGYVEIQDVKGRFLEKGAKIKGHEFHYFDSTDNGEDCMAKKPVTGREYGCVLTGEHYWLGFPHLYYPSNPAFAKAFVEKAETYRKTGHKMEMAKKIEKKFQKNSKKS